MISPTLPDGSPFDLSRLIQSSIQGDLFEITNAQIVIFLANGIRRDISMQWSPIKSENAVTGLAFVMRDITDELLINKRLHETQKMESIGRLAGGVAHDFNNLLTGIMSYTELLNTLLHEQHEGSAHLKGIFEASERARDLVKQLLTFSRQQPKENELVNMRTVIGNVTSLLQHTIDRRISIVENFDDNQSFIIGDRSQLHNSMLNLGINACDAMPEGGTLTFRTKEVRHTKSDSTEFTPQVNPGDYLEIIVEDSGVGIPKEMIAHIFEPFFTTRAQSGGSGLGLAAVYGTVKEHGGYIDVQSTPGAGTVFRLGFPTVEACDIDTTQSAVPDSINGSGCILIVDDEPYIVKTLEAILKSMGYETLSAANGREAVALFEQNHASIDLVILDMIMPELNGKETFKELVRLKPGIRVIMASGFLQEHNISDLMKLGILGLLQKPFRKNELAKRINQALRFDRII